MLVISNGAIKSGSTWLYNILFNLAAFERPPDQYLTINSKVRQRNPCIQPEMLAQFLENEDIASTHYLSKNHIGRAEYRDLLRSNPDVAVFDIERDVRDMVVSAYYDECNRNDYRGDFGAYYWHIGRYVVDEVNRYHDLWRTFGDNFCMVSYERLHTDFAAEVKRIARVLGVAADDDTIASVHEKTSITSLRNRYQDETLYAGEKFFRKGVVGDWKHHLDSAMLRDISKIQNKGIGAFDGRRLLKKLGLGATGGYPGRG
ncbi:MAG: sulfotransferase domain-containing protein [Halioglobus sp.]|nr:sulfotransferase domain-containing protein [Halioglobus sp.]